MTTAAYRLRHGRCGSTWIAGLLRPTGRWKLESGPYYRDMLFVEHQGFIFRKWIREDDIRFAPARESTVFNCNQESG